MVTPTEEVLQNIEFPFDLHKYQEEDINKYAKIKSSGLYYFMGGGKTVTSTALGIYKLLKGYNTVIALVPASLCTAWVDWLGALDLTVCDYRGTPQKRKKINMDADFIVASFQIFQNDYERFKKVENPFFLIDEATVMCKDKKEKGPTDR